MATLVKPRVQSEVQSLVQPEPTPRRFSVDEYYAMAEAGNSGARRTCGAN